MSADGSDPRGPGSEPGFAPHPNGGCNGLLLAAPVAGCRVTKRTLSGSPQRLHFSRVPQDTAHPHPPKQHPPITTVDRPIEGPGGPIEPTVTRLAADTTAKAECVPARTPFLSSLSLCVKSERRRRTTRAMAVAASLARKVMRLTISLFGGRFNSSKCKTAAKMTVARIKLLRNKRQAVVKQMRRDIALLLQSGQDATARVRVEHVLREQNILAANEFIELFCELIVARLQIIAKQRECPADLKEGISSLIFAAPRCSEIPELAAIRKLFEKKYGKDFVSAAIELRPNCGVNRMLIDKLSVRTPSGETKLKVLKEIAKEYQIEWDTTESEQELLKPPEEKIEGPQKFVSAASFPVKPMGVQSVDPNEHRARPNGGNRETMPYEDSASAAEAAAESARKAVAAAQAAAYLANKEPNQVTHIHQTPASFVQNDFSSFSHNQQERRYSPHMETGGANRRHSYNSVSFAHPESKFNDGVSVKKFHFSGDDDLLSTHIGDGKMYRRHSYNAPSKHSNIKFDKSDYEEDEEAQDPSSEACPPPARPPPLAPSSVTRDAVPCVHPKLPDYDDLAARFEALKYRN